VRVANDRPRIGVSACLLGERVRYDAGHKRDPFLTDVFGPHVEWVEVCPEVEAGLGTPREPMRLTLTGVDAAAPGKRFEPASIALVVTKTGEDVTDMLRRYAARKVKFLAAQRLSGFVLKKDSPSCGVERVKVYRGGGMPERRGRGLFAEALIAAFPSLPVEEEGRLADPRLRENFIERVFAYQRLRALFDAAWTPGDLVAFHTAQKLALMAHSPAAYRALGRLVAAAGRRSRRQLAQEYESGFMAALQTIATPRRHANVLQHMLGYFKATLDADAKAEVLSLIDEHRRGEVPLIVPLTLLRHHVRRQRVAYLEGQTYLEPHPRELRLRNHV
jgi:uncharacterized protein YbgA (DUF1722 family)/uncharacterized protein YbbK (DUF523 family)